MLWTRLTVSIASLTPVLAGIVALSVTSADETKAAAEDAKSKALFLEQVKPLLTKHCVSCHGEKEQESGLRVDLGGWLLRGGDRGPAVIAGKSGESPLLLSLSGKGDITQMPFEKPALKAEEIAVIREWIDSGAVIPANEAVSRTQAPSNHWSFQPIVRPKLPVVTDASRIENPIDLFIQARLEREKLSPSPEADRHTLIRRLSLDLRGLPPSLQEIEAFVNDTQPGAYERLVDDFLASPHYGERWGRHWLDLARYADSNGFTIDGPRNIWLYRDWVIDAINRDVPFDQFTIEQLAGDLLPDASREQLIATGFHRNTLINQEGGTDQEQFRVDAVVDRVSTTGSVWLGLTIGCAQCHSHKYDPISQREFYEMFAIFNNCDEPNIQVATETQQSRLDLLTKQVAEAEKPLAAHDAEFLKGLPQWEADLKAQLKSGANWLSLPPLEYTADLKSLLEFNDDRSIYVDFSGPQRDTFHVTLDAGLVQITALRLEALTHESLPNNGPGRSEDGNFLLSEIRVQAAPLNADGKPSGPPETIKLKRAVADYSQTGYDVSLAIDGKENTGWSIGGLRDGAGNVNREAIFFPEKPIASEHGVRLTIGLAQLATEDKLLLGLFRLSASDAPEDILSIPASLRNIVETPAEKRTKTQQQQLVSAFQQTDKERAPLAKRVDDLKKQRDDLNKSIPTTMILKNRTAPRETFIHIRGDFLRHGDRVSSNVPAVLPLLETVDEKSSRLDFARWLVSRENPLTARVTMNRFWQRLFGNGLVETENDFGTQGTSPTHPELLDWLADEFMREGWSMKSMLRLMVTSATYRQASAMRPELLKRDQDNRLLARQSRLRLEAENIRDNSLAASGLISPKMFGPGVYPPQPEGIYVLTQQKKNWPESQGIDRYRRGLYTYFWRSSPYPMLPTFDAPDANTTCTRRSRSNTPLQALTLANDRAFVEIAEGLARRVLTEGPDYDEGRLRFAFQACLSRDPSEAEARVLGRFLESQRKEFESQADAAKAAAPQEIPEGTTAAEAAAWTAVSRVLLNLDEFITRE